MSPRKFLFLKIMATMLLAFLIYGVFSDLRTRFAPIIASGDAFPRSLVFISGITVIFILVIILHIWQPDVYQPADRIRSVPWMRFLRWVFAASAALVTCWFFLYTKWSEVFIGSYVRLMLYLFTLWVMAWLACKPGDGIMTWQSVLVSAILLGSVFTLTQSLQTVVDLPFGLSWSEGNRIWDYSALFGRQLYEYPDGQRIPAYIDRGRQTLWGLPFLLPGASILIVRFWDSFLFTVPYILLGWFIFRPEKGKAGTWILLGLWSMLFLNQGPIYTPLVLVAIMVAGSRQKPLWLAVLLILLASYYAAITRNTWMFAPGIWAAVIALLENNSSFPLNSRKRWTRVVTLGLAGLIGGYGFKTLQLQLRNITSSGAIGTTSLSGDQIVATIQRQPLIWSRLLPGPTYPEGILLGLLIAVGPLIFLLVYSSVKNRWLLTLWQKIALFGSLTVFLAIGLLVSVKIGGGNNLHNLDMLLIGLLFVTGLAWEAGSFKWVWSTRKVSAWLVAVLLLAAILPVASPMLKAVPRNFPSHDKAEEALAAINEAIQDVPAGQDILFIDQRQLLTFGEVPRIPLIAEYEKKRMMDFAMADNAAYFAPFINDLANHRFTLIISEPLWIRFQGEGYHFGSENDAWVKWVSIPVLCYYQPIETFLDIGVQILIPRKDALIEPGVNCPAP